MKLKTTIIFSVLIAMICITFALYAASSKPKANEKATVLQTTPVDIPAVEAQVSQQEAATADKPLIVAAESQSKQVDDNTQQAVAWLIPVILGLIAGLIKLSKDSFIFKALITALTTLWNMYCDTDNKYASEGKALDSTTWAQRKQATLDTVNRQLPENQKSLLTKVFGSIPSALEYAAVTIGKGMAVKNAIKGIKW